MNRKLAASLVAGLLLLAIGAVVWSMRPQPVIVSTPLPTFDYADAASWAVRPDPLPPAVWEGEWDVDVVLISRAEALEADDTEGLEEQRSQSAEVLSKRAEALGKIGPTYAPYLRVADFDADVWKALDRYRTEDNRGRAFFVVTDAPLPAEFIAVLKDTPLLRDRFGGVLFFGEDAETSGFADDVDTATVCSKRYQAEQTCAERVELRRSGGSYDLSGGGRLVNGFVTWLNANASKLAEPLGDLEEVEIIDIRRPGETE